MRRGTLSILVAAVALSGAVSIPRAPAVADGIVDLSAATVSSPGVVSPPGGLVTYASTFRNEGSLPVEGVFTSTTTGGGTVLDFTTTTTGGPIRDVIADEACGVSGATVTCRDTLEPGTEKTVTVVVRTPAAAGSTLTNTASARLDTGAVEVLDDADPANDSASVDTQVKTGAGSAAFVREGETLTFKKHVLTVREAELGVVAFLRDTTAPETIDCGDVKCAMGLNVDFDQHPRFFGLVDVDVNFGATDPCRGIGNPSCHPLYFRKSPTDTKAKPVPACGTQAEGDPCLERTYKTGVEFHHVVVMETNDPDLLAPVSGVKG